MEKVQSKRNPITTEALTKIVKSLLVEIQFFREHLTNLRDGKIDEILHLAEEPCPKPRLHLTIEEIEEAQSHTETATAAAIYLGIHYKTYRRWCHIHNRWKIGVSGGISSKKLADRLTSKHSVYDSYRLKYLLFKSGLKKPECEICGWNKVRDVDQKMPLLLNYLDGNHKNQKPENLQILCYNDYFIMGRGYIHSGTIDLPDENF